MAITRNKPATSNRSQQKPLGAVANPPKETAQPNKAVAKRTGKSKKRAKPWTYTRRGYALAKSFAQLRSRKISSITTLLVFGVTLALPALILFTAGSLAALGNKSVGEESITAYLTMKTPDLDGAELANRLQSRAGIKEARYISRTEALALFNEQSDIGEAVDVLGQNPLPGAIIVYPDSDALSESAIKQLAKSVQSLDEVDSVQFDLLWVQRLQALLNLSRSIGWLLAGFLTLTALLVIGNTIRLELLRRQSELDVSRLLGASRTFLYRPLLYTGALYGFLGGIIACTIALLALYWLRATASELSTLYSSDFELVLPSPSQLLIVIGTATILGLLGAIVTLYQPSQHFLHNRRTGI